MVIATALPLVAQPNLLVSPAELQQVMEKARRHAWAQRIAEELIGRARAALTQPVQLPERGGQWPHWYSCPKDGARLETLSPTRHRCPVCNQIYSGEPYDSVVLYYEHMRYSRQARDCALAYRLTGDPQLRERARLILLGYAQRYLTYSRHDRFGKDAVGGGRAMAQTLDESVWLIPLAQAYSLIREELPGDERTRIDQGLFLPAANLIREHQMGIHNIQCWKNSAVGLAGFVTGHEELVKEAIDDPERGFRAQIAKGVTDDGLWWEGSLGYHQYTLAALWPLAEAARLNGIDLYSERYRKMFDAPLLLALPNGDPPGFNDNAGSNLLSYAPLYELAYARWGDPRHGRVLAYAERDSLEALLYGTEQVPAGPLVPTVSTILRHAGYAMLRSPNLTVAVRFGMHGGGHGHPDKLNIVTYGAGKPGGMDPGSIHYGVPLHHEWYRTTIAHNTVAVDEQDQAPVDGNLEQWEVSGEITRFQASVTGAYPGVQLRRHLQLQANQLEDRFECVSEQPHTYDWAFHVDGKFEGGPGWEPASGTLGTGHGYQHIRLQYRRLIEDDWIAGWDLGGVRLELRWKGAPGTEAYIGQAPGRDPTVPVSVLVVRRRATKTVFETTHRFVALTAR